MGTIERALAHDRHVDRLQRLQAPLAGNLEPPDRLDFVAEELDAHRPIPIGGEDIDDPAAERKLAGQLDRRSADQPVLDQPAGQLLDRHRPADAQPPRLPVERFAARRRLQKTLDAGHDKLRWRFRGSIGN